MALSTVSVAWRTLTLGQAGSGYRVQSITGWDELPAFSSDDIPVAGGHGAVVAPLHFAARTVTVTGSCFSQTIRDQLVSDLRTGTAPLQNTLTTEPLSITMGGLTLTADARVVRAGNVDQAGWSLGRFGWVVQWLCSDPLRYGPQTGVNSPLAVAGAGLALPKTMPATIPANPIGGSLSVSNVGNAMAPARFLLQGPISLPGFVLNGGTVFQQQVTYPLVLVAGDNLVVDTARGSAFLNGSYRAPDLGSALAKQLELRPGVNAVSALGVGSAGSSITVSFRPAYW